MRPFKTHHPVPSQGYLLYALRKRLRQELAGKTQDEIRELRQAGVEVTEVNLVPELAWTGDTSGELLERDDTPADVFKAKLLIIEATFVDDSVSWEQARARGHVHTTDLALNAHKFQNERILLTHFSPRYKAADILRCLDENLPPGLRAKCVPFLNGFA